MIEWTIVRSGISRSWADVPPDAVIESVNGRDALGWCEVCNFPILDGQEYSQDPEGIMVHDKCPRRRRGKKTRVS